MEGPTTASAREQRRGETHRRIAEAGLRLFLARGYEATTLDMLAEEAGISRRTFFAYFKSKDEILLAWDRASWQVFLGEVRKASPDDDPLLAVRGMLQRGLAASDDARLRGIAALMRSSDALVATRQASFAEREQLLFETLCEVWRQADRRESLRLAAMVLVGTLRVAVEAWDSDPASRPLGEHYEAACTTLDAGQRSWARPTPRG